MRPAAAEATHDHTSVSTAPISDAKASPEAVSAREPRNFIVLALYQIVMRMGWIFKTESVIMPAVMDSISGGAGWMRGCLPLFNRFGQSVPPLVAAPVIKRMRHKKWAMACCTSLMSLSFLALAFIWFLTGGAAAWLPVVFLGLYALFFMSTGINQLSFGTLQGKLIETTHRGRLMLTANVFGAISAIACALLLLPAWLTSSSGQFQYVFGFAGACFAASALIALLLAESADSNTSATGRFAGIFGGAWRTLRDDRNFRRLALIGAMFGCSMMLFPHYQALGRGNVQSGFHVLIWWIVVQNFGTALFSIPAGPLADRCGIRLVLRLTMLGICAAPLLALLLSHLGDAGESVYFFVFLLVGLTPVTIKMLNNYTLEISEPADHPRYLSTLSLCVALPVMFSPLVGLLVSLLGFEAIFISITALVLFGWILTFGLREPRHHIKLEEAAEQLSPEQ